MERLDRSPPETQTTDTWTLTHCLLSKLSSLLLRASRCGPIKAFKTQRSQSARSESRTGILKPAIEKISVEAPTFMSTVGGPRQQPPTARGGSLGSKETFWDKNNIEELLMSGERAKPHANTMKWQSYSGVATDDAEHTDNGRSEGHFISGAQSTQGLGAQTRPARSNGEAKTHSVLGFGTENTVEGTYALVTCGAELQRRDCFAACRQSDGDVEITEITWSYLFCANTIIAPRVCKA
jgi:hypothetical protein